MKDAFKKKIMQEAMKAKMSEGLNAKIGGKAPEKSGFTLEGLREKLDVDLPKEDFENIKLYPVLEGVWKLMCDIKNERDSDKKFKARILKQQKKIKS
jgi:hypothetical protein